MSEEIKKASDLADSSAAYWAGRLKEIKLQTGMFSFDNHEYQIEPMNVRVRRTCYMKGTQGGFSELGSGLYCLPI
jgi:hypothetical protein